MNHSRSREIFSRAQTVMPGGVNSPVRSFRSVGGDPFIAQRGEGAFIFDVDGNKYIDLVCSWGALIHGHSRSEIVAAVEKALKSGASFGVTCEIEIALGEAIKSAVSTVELVRLVNSGTEACMSAIRLARGYTGRELIVKFDGHYHGHGDSFLVGAGSGVATLHQSESAGVPQSTVERSLVVPFNDREAIKKLFKDYGSRIAAVILEPVSGNMGCVLPDPEFLIDLRRLTTEHKSLLIFDEVMTGFRLGRSGAQGLYAIDPDLSCFGKVIGGGLPLAAYGGRKEIMSSVSPLGPVYQAGTLSGNPLASAAGLASLQIIEKTERDLFPYLDSISSEWKSALQSHIRLKGYPVSVSQIGSMLSVFFRPEPPRNFAEAKESDLPRFKKFFWSLLRRGVYYPPSQYEACFLSSAHGEELMETVADASLKALDEAYEP